MSANVPTRTTVAADRPLPTALARRATRRKPAVATVPRLSGRRDLHVGDLVLDGGHGFFLEERSVEPIATLETLAGSRPLDATVHLGRGDRGASDALVPKRLGHGERARRVTGMAAR